VASQELSKFPLSTEHSQNCGSKQVLRKVVKNTQNHHFLKVQNVTYISPLQPCFRSTAESPQTAGSTGAPERGQKHPKSPLLRVQNVTHISHLQPCFRSTAESSQTAGSSEGLRKGSKTPFFRHFWGPSATSIPVASQELSKFPLSTEHPQNGSKTGPQ